MASKDAGISPAMHFAVGGLSGMTGWLFVHPVDVIKVRMQLASEFGKTKSMARTMGKMMHHEGAFSLFKGMSAGLLRQATYTTLRLGLYPNIRSMLENPGEDSFLKKAGAGLLSGAIAAFLSNPVEVALVRMQADGRLPKDQRRNYTNVFNALGRVAREDGLKAYWRGATPTVIRAMVVNLTQVATYDQFKLMLKKQAGMKDGVGLHFSASFMAAFIYSFVSLPFDMAKVKMQNQKKGADGNLPYRSTIGTLASVGRNEGAKGLWRGFGAYFGRGCLITVFTFLFMEQYIKLARQLSAKPAPASAPTPTPAPTSAAQKSATAPTAASPLPVKSPQKL